MNTNTSSAVKRNLSQEENRGRENRRTGSKREGESKGVRKKAREGQ